LGIDITKKGKLPDIGKHIFIEAKKKTNFSLFDFEFVPRRCTKAKIG